MVTIEADEQVWRYLMQRKSPGDSFNDVLRRELGLDDATDAEPSQRAGTPPETDAVSRARDALAAWDPSDVDSAKARQATVAVVGWLDGQATPQQRAAIVAWAREDGDALQGYAASTWWQKIVQPGLGQLVERGVVTRTPNVGYEIVEKGDGES